MARQPNDIKRSDGPPGIQEERVQRRKLGRIIHDERGVAIIEWAAEDSNSERVVLQILDGSEPHSGNTFQGRGRKPGARPDAPRRPKGLRKLDEWMKLIRRFKVAHLLSGGKKRF